METPSNGEDPTAKRAHDIGKQIAEELLTKQEEKSNLAQLGTATGGMMRWGVNTFFIPFVALFAWGGMAPESWEQQSYWPVVAGFYVFRQVISWVRGKVTL